MANPVSASTISTSIAALSITVTKPDGNTAALVIYSLATMPPKLDGRALYLYPKFTYRTAYKEDRASCGTGANAFWEATYDLNYFFAHAPVGSGRYGLDHNSKVSDNAQAIANAIAVAWDALGVVNIEVDVSDPTLVPGPDDKQFYGAEITLHVKDWRNAS
jgi:hypothetical protein